MASVETNILCFGLSDSVGLNARELADRLIDAGVLVHALGPDLIRMVTHYHITDADIVRSVEGVREVMEGALTLDVPLDVDIKVGDDWESMTPLQTA